MEKEVREQVPRRKRRKTKQSSNMNIIPVIILLVLFLLSASGLLIYYFMYASPMAKVKGIWNTEVSYDMEIEDNISGYLKEAVLGDEIDVSQYISASDIDIVLSLDSNGSYTKRVSEDSVNDVMNSAFDALMKCVSELILARIKSTDPSFSEEALTDTLIKDSIGMDLSDYLLTYGPVLMPSLEDLMDTYDDYGTFTIDKEHIYFISSKTGETSVCEYAVNKGLLVLKGTDTEIYKKKLDVKEDAYEDK